MDKLDKPTFLRKNLSLSETSESLLGGDNVNSAVQENSYLKETLNDLIQSANHNQKTQEKFYELELYFLGSQSYESLLGRILNDMKQKLRLSQVELILVDHNHEIRQLISEIYDELNYPNLFYVDDLMPIKNIYSGSISITLTQKQEKINKLYTNNHQQSHSVALLPLLRNGHIIGSLHLGSRDKERFHEGLANNFLHHLSSIVSVCIENSINQERYKHLSLVDILTRAKNRRYFFQVMAKEIARATRSNKAISCLFIDIDHFKNINDNHGHLVGDQALRQVAQSIVPLLRRSDVLARFGGEEFTVLLPDCEQPQAEEIAERIRQVISEINIQNENSQKFQITISIGVSFWQAADKNAINAEQIQDYLINQADKGVYQAKQDGRNCVRTVL